MPEGKTRAATRRWRQTRAQHDASWSAREWHGEQSEPDLCGSRSLAGWGAWFQRVQFLAWLKAHGFAGSDVDLSPGAGIAANARFARADAEDAKPTQLDAFAGRQSLLEALEDRVHCRLSLGARQASALNHVVNDVLFDQ